MGCWIDHGSDGLGIELGLPNSSRSASLSEVVGFHSAIVFSG